MGVQAGPEPRGGGRRGPVAVLPPVFRAGTCDPRFRDDRSTQPRRNPPFGEMLWRGGAVYFFPASSAALRPGRLLHRESRGRREKQKPERIPDFSRPVPSLVQVLKSPEWAGPAEAPRTTDASRQSARGRALLARLRGRRPRVLPAPAGPWAAPRPPDFGRQSAGLDSDAPGVGTKTNSVSFPGRRRGVRVPSPETPDRR